MALRLNDQLGLGFVTHGLDVVAIGPNDKSSVVAGAVLGPHARRAVVFATRFECQAIELLNLLPSLGCECQVKGRVSGFFGCAPDAKRGDAVRAAEFNAEWPL